MDKHEVIARRKLERFLDTMEHSKQHCPDPRRFPVEVTVHSPLIVTRIEFFFSGVHGKFDVFVKPCAHEIPYIDYIHRDDEEGRICIRLYPGEDGYAQIERIYKVTMGQITDDFIEKLLNSRKNNGTE